MSKVTYTVYTLQGDTHKIVAINMVGMLIKLRNEHFISESDIKSIEIGPKVSGFL